MEVVFESNGGFEKAEKWLKDISTSTPSRALDNIGRDGVNALSRGTPKRTGQTAAGWRTKITSKGDIHEIAWINVAHPNLSVNLAALIETGHGTRNGGYVMPFPYVKQSMDSIWKTAGDKVAKELTRY